MNEERISNALQSLPPEQAGPSFTADVLTRLEKSPRPAFGARWALAAGAALIILALGLGWREWRHQQDQRRAIAQLEMLLLEKQELEAELRSLRRLTRETRPVVYLGGNERVDLVLDLARFRGRGGWPPDRALSPDSPTPNDHRTTELRPEQRLTAQRAVY